MPKYRVLAKSYINNTIAQEGEIVEYDGKPGAALELIDAPKAESKRSRKAAEPDAGELGASDLV